MSKKKQENISDDDYNVEIKKKIFKKQISFKTCYKS